MSHKCKDKLRAAQRGWWAEELGDQPFWQRRFYDFNLWSWKKVLEKLRYIHENPVRRGLVSDAALWRWSSYRAWTYNEPGMVTLGTFAYPTLLLAQKGGAPERVA